MKKTSCRILLTVLLTVLAIICIVSCKEPIQCLISFETNGGSLIQTQVVKEGNQAARPSIIPTREGYVFENWYSDPELTIVFDFTYPINRDTTIYSIEDLVETQVNTDLP